MGGSFTMTCRLAPKLAKVAGCLACLAVLIGTGCDVQAAVTKSALEQVGVAPHLNDLLPLQLPLSDGSTSRPLLQWLGAKPTVWIFADYTCETLCGPVISIVARALADSGLKPGADFRLIVAGLDPKDTPAQASAMKDAQIGGNTALAAHSFFLRATAEDTDALTRAFGIRAVYDREHDQFAHPSAAFVVTPQGRIARALSGLGVEADSLRLALVEAGHGRIGNWTDHVRLLCYGFDPASGTYNLAIQRILFGAAAATMTALTLLVGLLLRRELAARNR